MKIGKVSESVLKRSILKQIKTKRNEVTNGAGIGEDCAILAFKGTQKCAAQECATQECAAQECAVCTESMVIENGKTIRHAVIKAVNNLAAGGAEPIAVMIAAMLPARIEEPEIRKVMTDAEKVCSELNVQIAGGHTSVSDAVDRPVLTITGIGKKIQKTEGVNVKEAGLGVGVEAVDKTAGLDVVATKWMALEATAILAKEKEKDLLTKYPVHLVEAAQGFEKYLSIIPEAAAAVLSGAVFMHDVSEGGIFGALWELAEKLGVGLEIDLKKIPVKQETIEICEYFDLNPYELLSGGCLLIAAKDGFELVNRLKKEHIPAVVIGKTTNHNNRVVVKDEECRFLEPRKTDEIYKVRF